MKRCTGCNLTFSIDNFHKHSSSPDGYAYRCKKCRKEIQRREYIANKSKVLQRNLKWRNKYPERWLLAKRKYQKTAKRKKYVSEWQKKPENAEKRRRYRRKRRKENPNYKLAENLRVRLYSALKGESKSASTIALLGCSISHLKCHLENQFTDGMSWENQGKWHVDHKIPCAAFDLQNDIEQRVCFWYLNLQPLWSSDNIRKSDKFKPEEKQSLIDLYKEKHKIK